MRVYFLSPLRQPSNNLYDVIYGKTYLSELDGSDDAIV